MLSPLTTFCFFYHIKQIDFTLPWVCAVKDHRRHQNEARVSVTHTTAPRVPLFLF